MFRRKIDLKDLLEQILKSRQMTIDGSKVVYDLTSGVDFSKPSNTAKALASVMFDEDISKWFVNEGDELLFKPTYRAEIIINDEPDRTMNSIIEEFYDHLSDDQLRIHYAEEIKSYGQKHWPRESASWGELSAYMAKKRNLQIMGYYLWDLLDETKKNITVVSHHF